MWVEATAVIAVANLIPGARNGLRLRRDGKVNATVTACRLSGARPCSSRMQLRIDPMPKMSDSRRKKIQAKQRKLSNAVRRERKAARRIQRDAKA